MFDRTEIRVKAGDGGNGAISFRREKFIPFGGPDGGDGGDGGDVIIRADDGISDLRMFVRSRLYRAGNGERGGNKKMHGETGADLVLLVPAGTIITDKNQSDGSPISDLVESGQRVVVVGGGKGGLGNVHFTSSTSQAPHIAQRGEAGGEKELVLEMKLIADAGIIGYPNVGKSTLLAAASAAKPKIADYPFTTKEPVLGVVEVGERSFVLAEIPGLIEDAHLGRGLGHDFLRHSLRTKVLIHLIDGSSASPVEDMIRVNTELQLFDSALAGKPQIVAVNKTDLPGVQARLDEIKGAFRSIGITVFPVSAATGDGVDRLMAEAMKLLKSVAIEEEAERQIPQKVFRPQPKTSKVDVHKEGDVFVVTAPGLDRVFGGRGESDQEALSYLRQQLGRLRVDKALIRAGVKPGDRVRCGGLELEW